MAGKAQYRIEIRQTNATDSMATMLRYNAGMRQTFQAKRASEDGMVVFEDKQKNLPQGMYIAALSGQEYPFLVSNDAPFELTITDDGITTNYAKSKENEDFFKYMDYQEKFNAIIQKAQLNYQRSSSDVKAEIGILIDTLRHEQAQFAAMIAGNHPHSLLASIIAASQTIMPPQTESLQDDSLQWRAELDFYKTNYFGNVNFDDNRLINTSILTALYSTFFMEILAYQPLPDIIKAANALLLRMENNHDMYKFTMTWLYKAYSDSRLQGHEAVAAAIAQIMMDSDKVNWLTDQQREQIRSHVKRYGLNPVGSIAPELSLQASDGSHASLSMLDAPCVLLYFYNPQCQVCRIVTPLLYAQFLRYKDKGLQVYAVYVGSDRDMWQDYIAQNNFGGFVNVWDNDGSGDIGAQYSLHAIPQIYVLDRSKKILHKEISIDDLQNILFIRFLDDAAK
jgi:peroxiredoxin